MLDDIICSYGGLEVAAMDVYRDIFKLGENLIQRRDEPKGSFKANPLGYMRSNNATKGNYRIMFDDTFEDTLTELQSSDFAIMNCITYFGRKNLQENASKMYALIIDLDGVTDDKLINFLNGAYTKEYTIYPLPNYLVLSGHGVHLYYVFEEPIPLFPNVKLQLKELKYALTKKVWNSYTSNEKNVQYQGINQGFRVIGGKTKIEGVYVRAFRLNPHPYSLSQLNEYVPEENRIDDKKLFKESKMTLADARKKYPEWYQKRIVMQQPKGTWKCNEGLYKWWMLQIQRGATFGHRYFCVMCLAIYAAKCGIERTQLENDARKLLPFLNHLNESEPFTESDMMSALECFDERYITFPRDDMSKLSAIEMPVNKRNYRKRNVHLKIARQTLEILNEDRGAALQGRKSKEDEVKKYLNCNPDVSVTKAAADLGVSRTTIYKYKNQ